MDLVNLEVGLKYLASQGLTLNVHEITGLNAGIGKLQYQEKFETMSFWGKLNSNKGAYYICFGCRNELAEFPVKQFYYSIDDFQFSELSPVTDPNDLATIYAERNTPFSGDPDLVIGAPEAEGEEGGVDEEKKNVVELHRVSQTVRDIDNDASVVPKGSYTLNENQQVVPAPDFYGLTHADALKLENYAHLRPPKSLEKLRVMARDDIEWRMSGFLDTLVQDLPRGAWAVRDEAGSNVHLRSLVWPGYAAFHVPRTRYFGGLYLGMGVKNYDLPFLL
eukprot:GEMP01047689.1.p1 GENE.GEMP01047689.1~~GEMP01047689.1.p1  ORF type:complete len:277 (+),score=53.07 GEMP01047689.1:104-934(+)